MSKVKPLLCLLRFSALPCLLNNTIDLNGAEKVSHILVYFIHRPCCVYATHQPFRFEDLHNLCRGMKSMIRRTGERERESLRKFEEYFMLMYQ